MEVIFSFYTEMVKKVCSFATRKVIYYHTTLFLFFFDTVKKNYASGICYKYFQIVNIVYYNDSCFNCAYLEKDKQDILCIFNTLI